MRGSVDSVTIQTPSSPLRGDLTVLDDVVLMSYRVSDGREQGCVELCDVDKLILDLCHWVTLTSLLAVTLQPVPVWHCLTVAQQYILPAAHTKDTHIVLCVTHILSIFSLTWTHTYILWGKLSRRPAPHTLIPAIAESALCIH